jgi:hypothetical protein
VGGRGKSGAEMGGGQRRRVRRKAKQESETMAEVSREWDGWRARVMVAVVAQPGVAPEPPKRNSQSD